MASRCSTVFLGMRYPLITVLTEGRLPETDQRRSMVRPLRAGFVTPLPGGSGAPPAGHYDPAAQDARRTRRKCQSAVCEAVRPELESLSLSNAVVKRREARRSASLAGGPLRKGDRPNRKAATGCGVPHQRLAALHSPHARNEGDMGRQDLDDKANPAPFKEHGRRSVG